MNTISQIRIYYLRPSRTIETIEVTDGDKRKQVYVYNYEGIHFRVSETREQLKRFFNTNYEPTHSFTKESELDDFLQKLLLE